jgi:hypothetical protein
MERYTWAGDPRQCNLVVNGRIEWLDRVRRRYTVRRHVCLVRFLCPEDRGLNLARCRFLVENAQGRLPKFFRRNQRIRRFDF